MKQKSATVNEYGEGYEKLIERAVARLIEIQEEDGAWPYEGVYRVRRQIPVGYRVGGTAIVCEALLYATPTNHEAANTAISRGIEIILKDLEHPLMKPSTENRYDVRVWGHIFALDFFCRLKALGRLTEKMEVIEPKIDWLLATLLEEEIPGGGWNYANRRAHAAFVSAPALQALLWAKSAGRQVPEEVFVRGRKAMLASRNDEGAYRYSGAESQRRPTALPGSVARSAGCEATLTLLGDNTRGEQIAFSLSAFYEHWDELEKRRQKSGTHEGPYSIAPYYFYYGHRYAGQAISFLPESERMQAYDRLAQTLLKTKEPDDTWNDRVFARSRAFGTAFSVLALLGDRAPLPPTQAP
ncbi:MAG: hypothetical protein MPJ50_06870 [Pirellulales bacterium]|nr:hypothetical protein [Pirellulales bacterium]